MAFPVERRNWSPRDVYHIQTRTIAQVEIRNGRRKSNEMEKGREKGWGRGRGEWRVEDARVKLVSGAKAGCRPVFRTNPVYNSRTAPSGWNPRRTFHPRLFRPPPPAPHEASPNTCAPTTFPDFAGVAVCEVNYRRIIAPYMPSIWLMRHGWVRIVRDTRTFTCLSPLLFCRQEAIRDFLELMSY